jgi:hypothetical protein
MTEAVLQYVWEHLRFRPTELKTTLGQPIILHHVGQRNKAQGPDFLNASVTIDGIRYSGAVELHLTTPLWFEHGHHTDHHYDKVILHVVYQTNLQPVTRTNGTTIPELELSGYLEYTFLKLYEQFFTRGAEIPCKGMTASLDPTIIYQWLDQLGQKRLENKAHEISSLLSQNDNDWLETAWQTLASRFGGNTNKTAFLAIAQTLPYKIIARNRDDLTNIEALLFGTAGMLEHDFNEDYPKQLKFRWNHLKAKYQIQPNMNTEWSFGGLRPVNFPTVRLAQLASLLAHFHDPLFYLTHLQEFATLLLTIQTSEYWNDHYVFEKPSKTKIKPIGKDFINQLLINAWIPLALCFQKLIYDDKIFSFVKNLKSEKNHITDEYSFLCRPKTALHSQGLLHLHKEYCSNLKCLECAIGKAILHKV